MIGGGWDAVLSVMAGDLSSQDWATRIGCSVREVRTECRLLGVAPLEPMRPWTSADVASLVDALHDACERADEAERRAARMEVRG